MKANRETRAADARKRSAKKVKKELKVVTLREKLKGIKSFKVKSESLNWF